jgi:hypothetical protein
MALMAVPAAMYQVVRGKLEAAGYDHAIHPSREGDAEAERLDMHGIWLIADGEAAELITMPATELRLRFLDWRGIDPVDACRTCDGVGRRCYGSTATWRGGMGGAMMTTDVCDACWGSGDRYHPGADLRRLRDEESGRVAKEAVDALARAAGATLSSTVVQVMEIVTILREAAESAGKARGRNRNPRRESIWFAPLVKSLADTLERGLRAR